MVYRLMLRRLITLLRSGRRLLIALGRLLRLDFRRRRKQRFARAVIDQRFHRREFIICRRERVGARRLLGSVPLLLGSGNRRASSASAAASASSSSVTLSSSQR